MGLGLWVINPFGSGSLATFHENVTYRLQKTAPIFMRVFLSIESISLTGPESLEAARSLASAKPRTRRPWRDTSAA